MTLKTGVMTSEIHLALICFLNILKTEKAML